MNWIAIGAVGELLGAIAVVISLAYLATQVVQNTRAVRATSSDAAVRGLRDWIRPLIQDVELSRIFRAGVRDWNSLDDDGRARFVHMMLGFMKILENLHFQYRKGTLDPRVWAGWEYLMTGYIQSPGGQVYWKHRRLAFSEDFRRYVESLPQNDRFETVDQLIDAISEFSG